jgi:peptidoglycan/LPS O-acetylase OafA/YrhL
MQKAQLPALTSLRFFAAGAVVLFHMSGQGLMPFGPEPALATGVSLFFVLSGFILTYNYQGRENLRGFYLARFARLWPVHLASLLFILFMLPQMGIWAAAASGLPTFLANLILFQAWVPNSAYSLSFNGVSWSISVEMFFYLAFPLALGVKRLWLLAAISLAATLCVVIYAAAHPGNGSGPWSYSWQHVILHFPPMRLFEFLTGMATARLFLERGRFKSDSTGMEAFAVVLVVTSVALLKYLAVPGPAGLWMAQCGSFFAFALLIYVLAAGNGVIVSALNHPLLVRLGEISFSTYMVHQIILRHAVQSKLAAWWSAPFAAFAVLFAAYAASYVMWAMVEVPARRALLARFAVKRPLPAE